MNHSILCEEEEEEKTKKRKSKCNKERCRVVIY